MKKNLIFGLLFAFILSLSLVSSAEWDVSLNENLVHYYTFDEESGTRYDSVGGLTSTGETTTGLGLYGNGVVNNLSEFSIGDVLGFGDNTPISLSFWFKNLSDTSGTIPVIIGSTNSQDFMFTAGDCLGYGGAYRLWASGICTDVAQSLINREWNNIFIVMTSEAESYVYINGNLEYTFTPNSFGGRDGTLELYSDSDPDKYILDELAVWNSTKSATDVETMYSLGEGMQYTNETTPEEISVAVVSVSPTLNEVVVANPFDVDCNYSFSGTSNATIYLEVRYLNGTSVNYQEENITTSPIQKEWSVNVSDGTYEYQCTIVANSTSSTTDTLAFSVNTTVIVTPPVNNGNTLNDVECAEDDSVCNVVVSLGAGLGVLLQGILMPLMILIITVMFVAVITVLLKALTETISKSIKFKK